MGFVGGKEFEILGTRLRNSLLHCSRIRRTLALYVKFTILIFAFALTACSFRPSQKPVVEYGYEVVHTYPHDPSAFTEGLFFLDGFLYESTGQEGQSSVRKVRLETGEIVQKRDLPPPY